MPDKCPYCDYVAASVAHEIAHMETVHPEIIRQRLEASGMLPDDDQIEEKMDYTPLVSREEHDNLREAIKRVNVDWDEVARTCGDPKCNGDCRWVRVLREAGVIT